MRVSKLPSLVFLPGGQRRQSGAFVPKLAGYVLLAFVLWLMVSTLVQPLLSSQATRAGNVDHVAHQWRGHANGGAFA
jgi:hypothetical protein